MKKLITTGLVGLCVTIFSIGTVTAGHADRGARAVAATVACGGNQVVRNRGDEFQASVYVLRNYNSKSPIYIDRIRFIDATGVTMFDFPGSALPVFFNGVLGPTDNSLEPHQTAQLRSIDVLGLSSLPRSKRPIQVLIDWSADDRALLLETALVRLARERIVTIDPDTGAEIVRMGKERGRHLYECRTIRRKKI